MTTEYGKLENKFFQLKLIFRNKCTAQVKRNVEFSTGRRELRPFRAQLQIKCTFQPQQGKTRVSVERPMGSSHNNFEETHNHLHHRFPRIQVDAISGR